MILKLKSLQHHVCKMLAVESLDLAERYYIEVVIQVGVDCPGDNHKLFVVTLQHLVGIFAEIARMSLFSVNEQHGTAYFAGV